MLYQGILVDGQTGEPVASANITLQATGEVLAQTKANGEFAFSVEAASFTVVFSKVGYFKSAADSTVLTGSPNAVLSIEPGDGETLADVIVTPKVKWILGTAAIGLLLFKAFKK